ncbi:(-)-alpha-terpineol synthase-like isoform X2 [Rhododendron vialii]|uniref:(-)-alpha-terpineol synthase-like isoform X2 n=1 Tax=Rhododendron vialii TaxID=182163 RepID=UPI00265F2B9C|nr:(-)-alpha-terpineol synthase-like isoform X2 [Rhododendron vialii]
MALALGVAVPTSFYSPTRQRLPSQTSASRVYAHGRVQRTFRCMAVSLQTCKQNIVRRSANYQPPIWDYDYVQSLNSKYVGDVYTKRAAKLVEDVKKMLDKVADPFVGLDMIDDLQRLGVFYHFEEDIKRVLENISNNSSNDWNGEDLHGTALKFRLMRQHGYNIPQGVFERFMDESGSFKACLHQDINGMLYLYEASYLSVEGESILDEARDFTTKYLRQSLKRRDIHHDLAMLVSHALELPLHWRVTRLEARWFIDVYERRPDINPTLLQLAKLDYNMVQATHQSDLKHTSRWWKGTGLGEKWSFARDRLMENFLWTVGMDFKPQFGYHRRVTTIVNALITTIDDVYDVYGTLDELLLFTNAVERWDITAMEQLPDYMKICFLALFNSINEIGYNTLKEQGVHIIPYLQKMDEMKRGDIPKSIQCYMHETGASEKEAREHIKYLIGETWKKMNKDRGVESPCSHTFVELALNLGRMAQCMYQYGDGHAAQDVDSRDRVLSLLINPVPLV